MKLILLALLLFAPLNADTRQGDVDQNGQVDISDCVALINWIFLGIEPPRLEWWERDTVATVLVFDGRSYIMRNHNISLWRQFVVTGSDTSTFDWIRIGEAMTIDSNKIVEVR